ncbi:MAG: MXAN_6640 family putative metalloprotease, partial [Myxococcota bacterium]
AVSNVCDDGSPPTCTAHLLMESDFSRSGYASQEEGIHVLVSHEYFHAVQNAYVDSLPPWWSEGTATWFEEWYDPTQSDFERLANGYFAESARSLNSRSQGPFDSFNYAGALFVHFIELEYGVDTLRTTFEAIGAGAEVLDAIDGSLALQESSLSSAFERFARWNLYTGTRATAGAGYPQAAGYDEVQVERIDVSAGADYNASIDPLAARYLQLQLSGSARLSVEPVNDGEPIASVWLTDSPDEAMLLDEEGILIDDTSVTLVLVNGDWDLERSVRVKVRNEEPPPVDEDPIGDGDPGDVLEEDTTMGSGGDDGCAAVLVSRTEPSWKALLLLFIMVLARRTRYPEYGQYPGC